MPGRVALTRTLTALVATTAVLTALAAAVPATGAPAGWGAPRASTSVVGTWAAGMGEVTVTGSGNSFTGTVSKKTTGFLCEHPVGEVIWTMTGEGPAYAGQARFDFNTGCPGPMSSATFVLLDSDLLQVNYVGPTGLSATLYLATRVSGAGGGGGDGSTGDTSPPVVEAIGSSVPLPIGSKVTLQYRVSDDSGKARVRMALYSAGTVTAAGDTGRFTKATGQRQTATMTTDPTRKGHFGPFYFCLWAEDKAGNRSAGWPESSCAWRPIEVSFKALEEANKVNGCGPNHGWVSTVVWNLILDVQLYGDIPVVFRPACYAHDAGYWGYAFTNPVTREVVDTRTWTRNDVDNEFRSNLETICARTLREHPDLVTVCQTSDTYGAIAYFIAVDHGGRNGFDADATVPGTQHEMPASTNPVNGGRNPGDPR